MLDREWFLSTQFDTSLLTHELPHKAARFFVVAPAFISAYFGATC